MPDLFGLDLAGIIASAFKGAGGLVEGTLTRVEQGSRTAGSLTGGKSEGTTSHVFQGFLEQREIRREGQVAADVVQAVTILGGSVDPPAVPEVNDRATLEGITVTLIRLLERDPAAATYVFEAE